MIASSGCMGAGMRLPDAFTKLHLRMNGEGNVFKDLTGKTITANGGVTQNSTSQYFLGNSAYFDGNGDYLTVPAFNISNDFTFECVVSGASLSTTPITIIGPLNDTSAAGWFRLYWKSINLKLTVYSTSWIDFTWTYTFTSGVDYHIAIVRTSGVIKFYVNGVQVGDPYSYSVYIGTSTGWRIGSDSVTPWYYYNGNMSELRLSSIARYTAAFIPPTRRQ